MKAKLLALAASLVLAAGSARASDISDYLGSASAKASARLAQAGVTPAQPLRIRARIEADGRMRRVAIADSSGSTLVDAQARQALRFHTVGAPPVQLIGREVELVVGGTAAQSGTP